MTSNKIIVHLNNTNCYDWNVPFPLPLICKVVTTIHILNWNADMI